MNSWIALAAVIFVLSAFWRNRCHSVPLPYEEFEVSNMEDNVKAQRGFEQITNVKDRLVCQLHQYKSLMLRLLLNILLIPTSLAVSFII